MPEFREADASLAHRAFLVAAVMPAYYVMCFSIPRTGEGAWRSGPSRP